MALVRLRELESAQKIEVDGSSIEVGLGEPLAMAIGASGRLLLSRSVKYHRPRGAVCYSNRCDGCLMRVDGQQSVATCTLRVSSNHVCKTQNVIGSAHNDLLAVTDWFFRDGLDHHHMFTQFGPVNRIMQKVARRIAGVGTLSDHTPRVVDANVRKLDVLVVGAGRSGLLLATELAKSGREVVVVDERDRLPSRLEPTRAAATKSGVSIELGVSALGAYEGSVLTFNGAQCEVLEPRQLVFATGTHENVPTIRGADHPGVITGQAAHRLLDEGFSPGENAVLLCGRPAAEAGLLRRFETLGIRATVLPAERVERLRGGSSVEVVELSDGTKLDTDAVVAVGYHTAVYELAVQMGANASYFEDGFWVDADDNGAISNTAYAIGACVDGARPREKADRRRHLQVVAAHINELRDVG